MQEPQDVAVILRLREKGWGAKRIGRELGVSRNTVRRYLGAGGYLPYGGPEGREKQLAGLAEWLREQFHRHRGNADVVRQALERVHGISVSLRTVERAVEGERCRLRAEAVATARLETPPGRQLQADSGQISTEVAGEKTRIYLCVLTLDYSRRLYAEAFEHERLHAWLVSLEHAFTHFGGIPQEVLVDNARALVTRHDVHTREVVSRPPSVPLPATGASPRKHAPLSCANQGQG